MHSYMITTEHLSKRFGRIEAVADLSLSIRPGEIYGLVGPDGAGKTTTIRMLCGILEPSGGKASVAGWNVFRDSEKIKREIGYVSQRFSLYGDLTVEENIAFFADVYQVPDSVRKQRAEEMLAFTRLSPFGERLADNLSGGMKQKLALACALIHQPKILFLDEPTTGVDPVSRRQFWQILYRLNKKGLTILVSTPYMDEAELCTTIGFMHGGRLLLSGAPAEMKGAMPGEVIEIQAEPRHAVKRLLAQAPGVEDVNAFGDRLHVVVDSASRNIPRLSALLSGQGFAVTVARQVKPSLEDVFVALTKRGAAHAR